MLFQRISAFTPGHRRDFTERPDKSQDDSWRHQHLEGEPENTWRSRCERDTGDWERPVARVAGQGISVLGGNEVPQTGEPYACKGKRCKKPTTATRRSKQKRTKAKSKKREDNPKKKEEAKSRKREDKSKK